MTPRSSRNPDKPDPLRLPLWVHQVLEYGLGLALIYQSVHSEDAPQIAAAGALVVLLAALTNAPAGAFRWIPPLLHRTLDVFVVAILLLAPFILGVSDPVAIVLCVGAAITLGWLHWHTRWIEPTKRTLRERIKGAAGAATAPKPPAAPVAPRTPEVPTAPEAPPPVGAAPPPPPIAAVPPTPEPAPAAPTPKPAPKPPTTTDATARVLGATVGKTARVAPGAAGRAIGKARAKWRKPDA